MKLLLFSGTHPRHLFINQKVIKHFDETMVILMKREDIIPNTPKNLSKNLSNLFSKHFQNRFIIEKKFYGDLDYKNIYKNCKVINVDKQTINSLDVSIEIEKFQADISFIFGVDLILSPVIDRMPKDKINLHLGLSPWYKGSATLFWPFYFLEPQFCGFTFHQIIKNPDAGEIIHQDVPKLSYGETIHEVAANCVLKASNSIDLLFSSWKKNKCFVGKIQKTTGRVWRDSDFDPSHLKLIYELFNDSIVDRYLDKELNQKKPKLFSCLSRS